MIKLCRTRLQPTLEYTAKVASRQASAIETGSTRESPAPQILVAWLRVSRDRIKRPSSGRHTLWETKTSGNRFSSFDFPEARHVLLLIIKVLHIALAALLAGSGCFIVLLL